MCVCVCVRHAGKRTDMSCVDAPVEMPAAKKRKLNEDAQDTAAPAQEKPEMSPSGERRKKKKRSLVGSQVRVILPLQCSSSFVDGADKREERGEARE